MGMMNDKNKSQVFELHPISWIFIVQLMGCSLLQDVFLFSTNLCRYIQSFHPYQLA